MSESPHPVAPFATDIRGKHRAKPVPPEPHRFVANVVSAPTENVFNIAQRQGVFHLYYHYAPDDLGRRIEMPEWVFGLGRRAENMPLLIGVNLLRQHRCDDLNRLQKRGPSHARMQMIFAFNIRNVPERVGRLFGAGPNN